MSKKQHNTKKSKTFTYTAREKLPRVRIKKQWALSKHFYSSETDPQIERDIRETERAYERFAKKYQNKDFTSSPQTLKRALDDFDALNELKGHAPLYYLSYRRELDATDARAEKLLNLLEQRLTKAANKLIFFELAIGKIKAEKQRAYMKDTLLAPYHFYLAGVFREAAHQLTESEERVLSVKSLTSRDMWVSGTEKILNTRSIRHKGKDIPIHGALMQYMDLPKRERHAVWSKAAEVLEEVAPVAENELNALYTDKKITDELRGFAKPYSATVIGYDHTEKSVEALIDAITTRGYQLSHRFFKHKKKWLNTDLAFIDRDETVGTLPELPFATAVEICRDTFYECDPVYGAIFDEMLSNGQIDVYPKKGKGGGAFCSSGINVPTLVFLNHNDAFDGLRTLAHEMGHAIHAYRSKTQPKRYQGHSIATAETASTYFENMVARRLATAMDTKYQIPFLNNIICDNLKTIVMCIARFSIELELHEAVRREGSLSWKEMQQIYKKHMKRFVGPAISVDDRDGLHFVYKPHFRMNFYQYTYSFGNLMSSIMLNRYEADSSYHAHVDQFLCAGEHASVDDIFSAIGIDTKKVATFTEGLALLERDIAQFQKLTAQPDRS